ncbi:MAG TPA: ABC transporter permease, partial [Gemmatimonadaceae bacterium]
MSIFHRIWFRLRALFDRGALENELDAEMRDHIARETKANVTRGMSEAEARRTALAAFGGVQHFREETRDARGMRWLEAFRQDAALAARSLARSPGFTLTVILTLALGVGANAAIYSILDRIYLRDPDGISDARNLRRLYEKLPPKTSMNGSDHDVVVTQFDYATFAEMRDALRGNADLAAYTGPDSTSLGHGESAVPVRAAYVSTNYFSTLGVRSARGIFFTTADSAMDHDPGVAVISSGLWDRVYGLDPAIIGRKIEVAKRPYVVVGVAGAGFTGVELNSAEVFLPLGANEGGTQRGQPWYKSRVETILRLVARVPDGDDRRLRTVATVLDRRANADMRGQMRPGSSLDTVSSVITGPIIKALGPSDQPKEYAIGLRVAGVTAIVLLIACANIANLLLIRGVRRRHEVAVRLALGVSRRRLMMQFLTEGALLAAIGGVVAILFGAWGGTALRTLVLPRTHWASPPVDSKVMLLTLAIALAAGIIAALLPALGGTRLDIVDSLKPGTRGAAPGRSRIRVVLLAAQTALSLVLLVGAGLFVRSVRALHVMPLGYATDEIAFGMLEFDGPYNPWSHKAERAVAFPRVAERVASTPGVLGVALAQNAPMLSSSAQPQWLPGVDSAISAGYYNAVSPEFFAVAGMRLIAGRALNSDDRHGPGGSIVVNAAYAAKVWPRESALGKCVILARKTDGCSIVVGIVENAKVMNALDKTEWPQYYFPLRAAVDSESVAPGAIIVRT